MTKSWSGTTIYTQCYVMTDYTSCRGCVEVYIMRIIYPNQDILVAAPDIKACFRWPKNHADLAGAMSFVIGPIIYLAAAMVFGSSCSPTSWEAFRRGIMALAKSYFPRSSLLVKYQDYLDMLIWDPTINESTAVFISATADSRNNGVLDPQGRHQNTPSHIYVDDVLLNKTDLSKLEVIYEGEVVTLVDVPEAGAVSRLGDFVFLLFESMFGDD